MEKAGGNASASVSRISTKPRKHGTSYISVGHSSEVVPRPEAKHGRICTTLGTVPYMFSVLLCVFCCFFLLI